MLMKSGWFLLLLAVLQVSARYSNVVPDVVEDVIEDETDERIVSGWEAQPGQLPYHASLRMISPTGTVGRCGGAVVARRWILTAAQCTAGRVSLVVRVGVLLLTDNNPETIFETTEWYNFVTFDSSRPTRIQPNDISLVRLRRPVEYSNLVKAIRVQSGIDAYRDYSSEQVIISGHGWTSNSGAIGDVLRWVKLRAISNDDCAKSYPDGAVLNTIVCAEYYNVTSQTACRGDFGGPLVHTGADGVPTLIGLFVFTTAEDNSCPSGMPTGYTRPGPYLPWFRQITDIDFENPRDDDDDDEEITTPWLPVTTTVEPTTNPSTTTAEPITTPSTTTAEPTTTPSNTTAEPITNPSTTTPEPTTAPATTNIPSTTNTPTTVAPTTATAGPITTPENPTTTTESGEQVPEITTPEGDASEGSGDDDDSSESDNDDDMAQLLKRLQVLVKVKVRMDKYNSTNAVGMKVDHHKH